MPIFLLLLLAVATYAQPQPPLQDQRDGKTYRTVKIGTQTWMAENLNYEIGFFSKGKSKCYDNKSENCEKYGRLYNWQTALNVCPKGWYLPSKEEWDTLLDFTGGEKVEWDVFGDISEGDKVAGGKLKAKSGWNDCDGKSGNGTDEYGFSALPGSQGFPSGHFNLSPGYGGSWWSSDKYGSNYHAYSLYISYCNNGAHLNGDDKTHLLSVRCVKTSEPRFTGLKD